MFHHFHGNHHPVIQGSISSNDLEEIITYIGKDRIINANDWVTHFNDGTLPDQSCCLTFDDTLLCQYDIALPVLKRYGLTAIWFISSSILDGENSLELFRKFRTTYFDNIDEFYDLFFDAINDLYNIDVAIKARDSAFETHLIEFSFYSFNDRLFRYIRDYILGPSLYENAMFYLIDKMGVSLAILKEGLWMNHEHINELHKSGHYIGLHSHSHPTKMSDLSYDDQYQEYYTNLIRLRDITSGDALVASHPCNSYNSHTLEVLKKLGVNIAFRSNMEPVNERSIFEVPRIDHMNIMEKLNGTNK